MFVSLVVPLVIIVGASLLDTSFLTSPPRGSRRGGTRTSPPSPAPWAPASRCRRTAPPLSLATDFPAAYALNRCRIELPAFLSTVLVLPIPMPELVQDLSLMNIVTTAMGVPTFASLVTGHALLVLPCFVHMVSASLASFDISIGAAAVSPGAPRWKAFPIVVLPDTRAGVIADFIRAFIISLNDVSISLIAPWPGVSTLPIQLHAHMDRAFDPTIASVSVLMMGGHRGGHRRMDARPHAPDQVMPHDHFPDSPDHRCPLPLHAGAGGSVAACGRKRARVAPGFSGCGKTTTLRLVAGLLLPTRGAIRRGEQDPTRLPAHKRNIGLVFQNCALLPHPSVRDYVAFGLKQRGVGGTLRRRQADEMPARVGPDHSAERMPAALSGGQVQRVALARALVIDPPLLMFDAPLSNLDARLRVEMQVEIRRLQRE